MDDDGNWKSFRVPGDETLCLANQQCNWSPWSDVDQDRCELAFDATAGIPADFADKHSHFCGSCETESSCESLTEVATCQSWDLTEAQCISGAFGAGAWMCDPRELLYSWTDPALCSKRCFFQDATTVAECFARGPNITQFDHWWQSEGCAFTTEEQLNAWGDAWCGKWWHNETTHMYTYMNLDFRRGRFNTEAACDEGQCDDRNVSARVLCG